MKICLKRLWCTKRLCLEWLRCTIRDYDVENIEQTGGPWVNVTGRLVTGYLGRLCLRVGKWNLFEMIVLYQETVFEITVLHQETMGLGGMYSDFNYVISKTILNGYLLHRVTCTLQAASTCLHFLASLPWLGTSYLVSASLPDAHQQKIVCQFLRLLCDQLWQRHVE